MLTSLLLDYAKIARPIILESFRADSCLASTQITISVLSYFGYTATRYPCNVHLFNSAFVKRAKREGRVPSTQEETRAWTTNSPLWSVGIMRAGDPTAAHYCAICHGYLIDASIDQCNRPHKSIILPGVLTVPIPTPIPTQFPVLTSTNTLIIYSSAPDSPLALTSPDLTDPTRYLPTARQITRLLRHHAFTRI